MSMLDPGVFFTDLEDTPIPVEERWDRRFFANPAAGQNGAVFAVPGDFFMMMVGAYAQLTTDANAGNRSVFIRITDPDSRTVADLAQGVNTGANASTLCTWSYNWSTMAVATGGFTQVALPIMMLFPGYTIQFRIVGAQAGDQLSRLSFLFLRRPRTSTARRVVEPPTQGAMYDRSEDIFP